MTNHLKNGTICVGAPGSVAYEFAEFVDGVREVAALLDGMQKPVAPEVSHARRILLKLVNDYNGERDAEIAALDKGN